MMMASLEQQKLAMLSMIQQMDAMGIDLKSVAEGAKLRLLGSLELYTEPAGYRVRCASAVDELVDEALHVATGETGEVSEVADDR